MVLNAFDNVASTTHESLPAIVLGVMSGKGCVMVLTPRPPTSVCTAPVCKVWEHGAGSD
jgi:hypothetical protein